MKTSFKTEIVLNEKQKEKLHQTIGVCRYVYNLFLSKNKETYEKEKAFMSGYDFSKWLNHIHTKEHDKWIKKVSSKAVKKSIMNADTAFKRFFKGVSKFPRYKEKKKQDVKAYFIESSGEIRVERHRIKVPTLGWVRLKEYGYIPLTGIKSVTLSVQAGCYYISASGEKEVSTTQINTHDGIGIDLGLKDFAIGSHYKTYKNINKTVKVKRLEKRLKRQQRKLSRKIRMRKVGENCSKNMKKQIVIVQKLHQKLTNIRKEYVRYVVNCLVKAKPKYITIEDLNVTGMMKNRHLAKVVAKQNFYYFRSWLQMKCEERGIELRVVDRFYPSSKLCSCCGFKKKDLKLSDRVFVCSNCDAELDRDFNASLNLKYAKEYTVVTSL